jgi:ubiquinone/menaquinone biosynthesis C-methylase UbiE
MLPRCGGRAGRVEPAGRALGAKVLATDWSPAMIQRFQARVRDEGLSNAVGRVMDAHDLKIEDDTFDVTGSQLVSCSCRTRRSHCARWSG